LNRRRKRETKENAIELVNDDKRREYELRSIERTGKRQLKLASMKMVTCTYKGRIPQREFF